MKVAPGPVEPDAAVVVGAVQIEPPLASMHAPVNVKPEFMT